MSIYKKTSYKGVVRRSRKAIPRKWKRRKQVPYAYTLQGKFSNEEARVIQWMSNSIDSRAPEVFSEEENIPMKRLLAYMTDSTLLDEARNQLHSSQEAGKILMLKRLAHTAMSGGRGSAASAKLWAEINGMFTPTQKTIHEGMDAEKVRRMTDKELDEEIKKRQVESTRFKEGIDWREAPEA